MSKYSIGANFERRVLKVLTEQGWLGTRSAGSRTPVDIIALRQGEIMLIQCKVDGNISKAERLALLELAKEHQVQAFIVSRDTPRIRFEVVRKP